MEQAGVPRSVAMKISGHKTESIHRRYALVAERDIADGPPEDRCLFAAADQLWDNSGTIWPSDRSGVLASC